MDDESSARCLEPRGIARTALAPLTVVIALLIAGCGMADDPFAGGSHDPPDKWQGCDLEFCREDPEGYHCFYSDSECFHWTTWNGEDWERADWACSY